MDISVNCLSVTHGDYLALMLDVKKNADVYRRELRDLGFRDGS